MILNIPAAASTLFQGVGKDGMNDREVVGLVDVGESECCVRQIEVVLG